MATAVLESLPARYGAPISSTLDASADAFRKIGFALAVTTLAVPSQRKSAALVPASAAH